MENSTLSNREILEKYLNNGLLRQCVECQFSRMKDRQFEEDMFQDLCIIILEYPNEKLNDAHRNNHMNALITKILVNNLFSTTSPFYKKYYKQMDKESEITDKICDTVDDVRV